jgi:hypothetical protein
MAPDLVCRLPAEVRSILGDRHYNTPELREQCAEDERILVTSHYGRYPHTDEGVEVRPRSPIQPARTALATADAERAAPRGSRGLDASAMIVLSQHAFLTFHHRPATPRTRCTLSSVVRKLGD